MARRPIFIPSERENLPRVRIEWVEFEWHPGLSKTQKQKSICSLHESAQKSGIAPALEISSKSAENLGVELSAFNLAIATRKLGRRFSVEVAFQGSKVFQRGGPYTDLLDGTSRDAKKDVRLMDSGKLIGFTFFGRKFPLKPSTFFYDWLYINALNQKKGIDELLARYNGFTDIEFNPKRSVNCQAFSAALFVSLVRTQSLTEALSSPEKFLDIAYEGSIDSHGGLTLQESLF